MTEGVVGAAPPPGWYHDDHGVLRWWDGAGWSDAGTGGYGYPPAYGAPTYGVGYDPGYGGGYGAGYGAGYGGGYGPQAPTDGRTMALLAHLGVFLGGFILPLIIYLTVGKNDPFVRHHSAEALNLSLTYTLFGFVGMALSFATLFIGFIVFLPLFMVAAIGHIVLAIIAAMKASRGEWYRYPINIRFVSGAVQVP